MFTGIIGAKGLIKRITKKGNDVLMEIETLMEIGDIKTGDSIAVNGACLTVTGKTDKGFTADVSAETLARTNLKILQADDRINLEKALRLSDFLGGHIVLGHVDGMGKIQERNTRSNSIIFGIGVDDTLDRYLVEKGSVTIDGVSLTVNTCKKNIFYVSIIPHTASSTTLETKKPGDLVNIETDILGKYVEKFLNLKQNKRKGVDMAFLAEHGFIKE
jgi:riboflavin synthase